MPQPALFIKCIIFLKPFRSPPINHIYSCSLWWGAFSDMDHGSQGVPRGQALPPWFHKICYISETVQIPTHKLYIFLFLKIRRIYWHGSWDPWVSPGCMPHPLHFAKCLISRKPFSSPPINHIYSCSLWWGALSDMDHGYQRIPDGMPHPLHFIKCVISRKLFTSPPINHIYCCSLWQAAFSDIDPRLPRGHAPAALSIKCIMQTPFRSPPVNHIYSC